MLKVRLAVVLLLSACGGSAPQETTAVPSVEPSASPSADSIPSEPEPVAAPPPSGEAPTISLTGTPASATQHVAISVTNHGATSAELGTSIGLEVQRDGAFVPAQRTSLALRYDCAQEAPACVTLAPGAELIPPEWLGTWGDVQCVCTRCGPAEAGTYRFVLTTCDGAHRIEGTPFTITR